MENPKNPAVKEVPFTYLCTFAGLDERMRRMMLAEFAANGARHIVLSDGLFKLLAGSHSAPKGAWASTKVRPASRISASSFR